VKKDDPKCCAGYRGMANTFIMWATEVQPQYVAECFRLMSVWAVSLEASNDEKIIRVLAKANREVMTAFIAAVYIRERESTPLTCELNPLRAARLPERRQITDFQKLIAAPANGNDPQKTQIYSDDLDRASVVIATCRVHFDGPQWLEIGDQLYRDATGDENDKELANRYRCDRSWIIKRRKQAWDCIENTLAIRGIIDSPKSDQ
jgi:hypothetical protein